MIQLILANKQKHITHVEGILERGYGNAGLLREPNIVWFLFLEEDKPIGLAYAYAISDVRMYLNIVLPGKAAHHPERKKMGKDLISYLKKVSGQTKLETTIPVSSSVQRKYFHQLGFKREGVARQSIVVNGSLEDQHYMGVVL